MAHPTGYHRAMYLDALSFLEDEREGWRAFEALDELTDDQLTPGLDAVHGWSGRDVMAHPSAWQEQAGDWTIAEWTSLGSVTSRSATPVFSEATSVAFGRIPAFTTQLTPNLESVHGWSGRDLMAHLIAWLELAVTVAKELAINESSPSKVAADADWDARGDAINEEIRQAWLALPMDEVRQRFRTIPGELRGYLTVVPEARWLKNADYEEFFLTETIDHYEAHADDLAAVLASAGRS